MPGTYSHLRFHLIFSAKNREPLITQEIQIRLYPFIGGIVRDEKGVLLEIGGMPDHVHLLVGWRTDDSLANLLRNIKSRSSGWIHETFPESRTFRWQEGYGAFSVSHSQAARVRRYIQNQAAHHRKKTFKEEYLEFLRAHEIEFDEQQVFD
jgi:putative transposase